MGAHDGAVDHRIFIVGIAREVLEEAANPLLGPARVAPMGVLSIPEALRQVAPGDPGAIAIEHGFDKSAVVLRRDTAVAELAGQQVRYPFPVVIAQSISGHRSACSQPTCHESHKPQL
jgi:hypothetical protein